MPTEIAEGGDLTATEIPELGSARDRNHGENGRKMTKRRRKQTKRAILNRRKWPKAGI